MKPVASPRCRTFLVTPWSTLGESRLLPVEDMLFRLANCYISDVLGADITYSHWRPQQDGMLRVCSRDACASCSDGSIKPSVPRLAARETGRTSGVHCSTERNAPWSKPRYPCGRPSRVTGLQSLYAYGRYHMHHCHFHTSVWISMFGYYGVKNQRRPRDQRTCSVWQGRVFNLQEYGKVRFRSADEGSIPGLLHFETKKSARSIPLLTRKDK